MNLDKVKSNKKNIILEQKVNSETELISFGKNIIKKIPDTKLFLLDGEVGVGKTTLTKGIALALSIKDTITSPTYGYKSEYKKMVHYDLYQMDNRKELKNVVHMIREDFAEDNYVIVEWPKSIKINEGVLIKLEINEDGSRTIKAFK